MHIKFCQIYNIKLNFEDRGVKEGKQLINAFKQTQLQQLLSTNYRLNK